MSGTEYAHIDMKHAIDRAKFDRKAIDSARRACVAHGLPDTPDARLGFEAGWDFGHPQGVEDTYRMLQAEHAKQIAEVRAALNEAIDHECLYTALDPTTNLDHLPEQERRIVTRLRDALAAALPPGAH